jgi:hypothetical protein
VRIAAPAPGVLALAALLALAGSGLGAATLDARTLVFVPVRYSAGDEVTVRASIVPESGETLLALDLRPGAGLPAAGLVVPGEEADPELRGLRLSRSGEGWLLEASFVPWSPGPGSLPEARYKGFRLPALPYAAISVLGPEDRDPSPPRPQRDPPGTALFLYGLAGFLIAVSLGIAGAAAYLVPAARALLARRRAAQAFKRFGKSLDYLVAESGSADPAIYFAALSRSLRMYLASRVLPEAPALTASELGRLPESAFPSPSTKDRVAALVARADSVRYGEAPSGKAVARQALVAAAEEARAIGEANEEALLARV